MLKKILKGTFTPDESENTISSFDQIGDIIIVRIPDSLLSKKNLIGETLLKEVKIARSVFYQASPVAGDFRIRNLELIAGENKTRTEYKEFGIKFWVDVEKAFFSPRLSNERERIANFVQAGEIVVNMFGGIGMFSIMIAKRKKCTVYSIDINPFAVKLCEENITLNKLEGEVISIQGDASQIIASRLENKSDRTLMLLPEKSINRWSAAPYHCSSSTSAASAWSRAASKSPAMRATLAAWLWSWATSGWSP
jgi:tRNA (guanine37-N1)-methyltransferase